MPNVDEERNGGRTTKSGGGGLVQGSNERAVDRFVVLFHENEWGKGPTENSSRGAPHPFRCATSAPPKENISRGQPLTSPNHPYPSPVHASFKFVSLCPSSLSFGTQSLQYNLFRLRASGIRPYLFIPVCSLVPISPLPSFVATGCSVSVFMTFTAAGCSLSSFNCRV